MKRHLTSVDDISAAEHAAVLAAFEWALDVLGVLDDERAALLRIAGVARHPDPPTSVVFETLVRHVVAIADDARVLLADEDEVREWMRSPNPALWTRTRIPVMTTPLRVMLDYEGGVRAIRTQLSAERQRKYPPGLLC